MKMKRSTARERKSRFGYWVGAAVLALLLLGGMSIPASAGNVHLSFGIGVPLPVYSYPAYPAYPPPAVVYPPAYYAAPVYPPVVVTGFYGGYYRGGHGHYHRGHGHGHGRGHWKHR
jgi:hypothetical protein